MTASTHSPAPAVTTPAVASDAAIAAIAERFWAKVDRSEQATSCWLWTAQHARFGVCGIEQHPERVAWELTTGEDLTRIALDNVCGIERCVNPAHYRKHQGSRNGRPPSGVFAKLRTATPAPAVPIPRAVVRPAAAPERTPARPVAPARAPQRFELAGDTALINFLGRPGVLVRTFPGGTTVVTAHGDFWDPDPRVALRKAIAAEEARS